MKKISDKKEIFDKIDVIYNKLRYQRRQKKTTEKEIWQELYEVIPYRFILENEEVLDVIVNICKENYKESLILLKDLINESTEIKYYRDVLKEDIEDIEDIEDTENKDYSKEKIEDKINEKETVAKEKYWIDFKSSKSVTKKDFSKSINGIIDSRIVEKIEDSIDRTESNSEEKNISSKDRLVKYSVNDFTYRLERVQGEVNPQRKAIKLNKIIRNNSIVKILKGIYNNTCQLCGTRLEIGYKTYYSEVHHIRPLGNLHKGSDTTNNAIVLCPNCHTLFDRGSIAINTDTFSIISFNKNNSINNFKLYSKHKIDIENIKYHNNNIYIGRVSNKEINDNSNDMINIKNDNIYVDYKDNVEILELDLNETIYVKMKSYWEYNDMPPLQKKLLNKKINTIVSFNKYQYKICSIEKSSDKVEI